MKQNRSAHRTSIRRTLLALYLALMLLTAGLIGYFIFSRWSAAAREITQTLSQEMNSDILGQVDSLIRVPLGMNEENERVLRYGLLDLSDETLRDKYFVGVLSACDSSIYSISYGSAEGEYYGARRSEDGAVEIMKNNAETGGESWYYAVNPDQTAGAQTVNAGLFDPRTRDWYKAAVSAGGPVASPIYRHFVMNDLTVSFAVPIYSGSGRLRGVLGTHMLLSGIGDYLKKTVSKYGGYAFIVEKDTGYLVANSMGANNFTVSTDGTVVRSAPDSLENAALREGYSRFLSSGEAEPHVKDSDGGLYMNIQEYTQPGLDWLVISAVPGSLLTRDLTQNIRIALLLVLLCLLAAFAVYFLLAHRLLRPIDELLATAENFSAGDLSRRSSIQRNDEIGRMAQVFNQLADRMQSLVADLEQTVVQRTEELRRTNLILEERREQLRLILDSTAEGVYGADLDGNCTFCNESCLKLLGYGSAEELLGKNMHRMTHHSHRDGTPFPEEDCPILRAIRGGESVHSDDEVFWRADGTGFDAEYRALPQRRDGKIVGAVITFTDITERRQDVEQIRFLSCHDSMTGLINRRCFEQEMKRRDARESLPFSILFIDLNGLKLLNDTFGHAYGDELIQKAARVLTQNCREEDTAARIGGDEFSVLLPNTTLDEARQIGSRLRDEFSREKIKAVSCSLALGAATKSRPYQKIEKVLETAENEMYKEKAVSHQRFGAETIASILRSLHERSPREKAHAEEVRRLCGEMGLALGLPETECKKLRDAGYLHDIGKVTLSDALLSKDPETLTEPEREMMWEHPAVGYRILNLSGDTLDLAEGIYSHHERWDGSGYPKGLKGEEIPLMSRMIAVTEAYERLRSHLGYTEESREQALREVHRFSGSKFDPRLVDLLIELVHRGI